MLREAQTGVAQAAAADHSIETHSCHPLRFCGFCLIDDRNSRLGKKLLGLTTNSWIYPHLRPLSAETSNCLMVSKNYLDIFVWVAAVARHTNVAACDILSSSASGLKQSV